MTITTAPITGSVPTPGGSAFTSAILLFTLSAVDTEGAAVIAPHEHSCELDGINIPAGFEVWRNTEGLRGTFYRVTLVASFTGIDGVAASRKFTLGNVQVGDGASYTIADLLNSPVPDDPDWFADWRTAIEASEAAAAASAAAAAISEDNAAASETAAEAAEDASAISESNAADSEAAAEAARDAAVAAAQTLNATAYATRADMPAAGTAGRKAYVYADPTASNNGLWFDDGSAWVKDSLDVRALLPTVDDVAEFTPLAAIGGDVLLWHDGEGVDLVTSPAFDTKMGRAGADATGTVTPLMAVGGDVLVWHDGQGVDVATSPAFDSRMGRDGGDMTGTVTPIHAIGGDAIIWHDGDGVDLVASPAFDAKMGRGAVNVTGAVVPVFAIGGDAVAWHDGQGIDLATSPVFDAKMGRARENVTGAVTPLFAIGADLLGWFDGFGIDLVPSPALSAKILAATPPSVTGAERLRRTRAKIAQLRKAVSGAQLRVLLVGDSWTANPHLITELKNVLCAVYPLAGDGFISADTLSNTLTGAAYALSAGWTLIDGSLAAMTLGVTPDGQMRHTDADDQTATWTNMRCTRFSIYVRQHGGTWRWRVDGGAWTTVTDDSSGDLRRVEITGLTDAAHTINIDTAGNTGTVALAGYYMSRDGVSGITLGRFADSGNTALGMSGYLAAQTQVLIDEPPDLIVTVLGTNDSRSSAFTPATYVEYMQDLVAAARGALSDIDVIHLLPPTHGMTIVHPLTDYRDAMWQVMPTLQTSYLSLSEHYGAFAESDARDLWADLVHPNFTGARMIADLINDLLIRI